MEGIEESNLTSTSTDSARRAVNFRNGLVKNHLLIFKTTII